MVFDIYTYLGKTGNRYCFFHRCENINDPKQDAQIFNAMLHEGFFLSDQDNICVIFNIAPGEKYVTVVSQKNLTGLNLDILYQLWRKCIKIPRNLTEKVLVFRHYLDRIERYEISGILLELPDCQFDQFYRVISLK